MSRPLELGLALVGLALLWPVMLLIAVSVKLDSPGPVFHRGLRAGKDGLPFRIYKFRTMLDGAERLGPRLTAGSDSRVTRTGAFLRRTKLDELPQLLNVLKGEMSVVGPRPEDPYYVADYTPNQRQVLRVRPGITSPASIAYRDEETHLARPDFEAAYRSCVLPDKLAIDLAYLETRTLLSDLGVIARTLAPAISGRWRAPSRTGAPLVPAARPGCLRQGRTNGQEAGDP